MEMQVTTRLILILATMLVFILSRDRIARQKQREAAASGARLEAIAGVALDLVAFPKQAAPGEVPDEKIFLLGLAVGPCMFVLYLMSLVFLRGYRITRARHSEILAELARRRGAGA